MPVSPQERTAITEQTTSGFRHDLDSLSPEDRARVLETLRHSYGLLRDNPRSFFAKVKRPIPIHLKGGLSSSLYSLRAGRDLGLILAVDDDPIFGQILVTLFRVVRHGEVDRSYRSIAHLLYRNQIERNGRALFDDLGENSLPKVHPSLSEIRAGTRGDGRKAIPAKNSSNRNHCCPRQDGLGCVVAENRRVLGRD